jgi:hypothetical protein
MRGALPPLHQYVFMAWCLVKHKDILPLPYVPVFDSQQRQGIFLFASASGPALGPTQPPMKLVPVALPSGVKASEREADHSGPSRDKVKNVWS